MTPCQSRLETGAQRSRRPHRQAIHEMGCGQASARRSIRSLCGASRSSAGGCTTHCVRNEITVQANCPNDGRDSFSAAASTRQSRKTLGAGRPFVLVGRPVVLEGDFAVAEEPSARLVDRSAAAAHHAAPASGCAARGTRRRHLNEDGNRNDGLGSPAAGFAHWLARPLTSGRKTTSMTSPGSTSASSAALFRFHC